MKTPEDFFADWEGHVFGFGYGTGEPPVLEALCTFLQACHHNTTDRGYDYREIESVLTPATGWLLINVLCHAGIIEYGTSPRFGWLTLNGVALRDFCRGKSAADLHAIVYRDENYIRCAPDYCNCSDAHCCKLNPFWPRRS